jgi:hypothetical protein
MKRESILSSDVIKLETNGSSRIKAVRVQRTTKDRILSLIEDPSKNIGKILAALRKSGIENELEETDIMNIRVGLNKESSLNSQLIHFEEAFSLLIEIEKKRSKI